MNQPFVQTYAPYIFFNEKEPFFPVKIGYTIFQDAGPSPSFPRTITLDRQTVKYVIEYALYWHFDIQHLYSLEHIWVYINQEGMVVDCEASFHGKYLKALIRGRRNIRDNTHVKLYSQPGKHGFSPMLELFDLIPDMEKYTYEWAGKDGLLVTPIGEGRYHTNEEINQLVERYLQQFRFRPSLKYRKYDIPNELFVPWKQLYEEIPIMVQKKLVEIQNVIKLER